jgi:hypothetical protein
MSKTEFLVPHPNRLTRERHGQTFKGWLMVRSIADIVSELSVDPWRTQRGFDAEFAVTNEKLLGANADDAASALREWLSRHQPCLFGRIAAKKDLLTFCILDDEDLTKSDDKIRDKIQAARLHWTKAGYEGRKSGFIVLAIDQPPLSGPGGMLV